MRADWAEYVDGLERANEHVDALKMSLRQGELSQKDYDKSIQKVSRETVKLASQGSESPAVLTSAARVMTQTGDLKAASSYVEKALKLAPEDPFPLVTRGIIRYEKRDFTGAAADAASALSSDPANKAAYALYKLATGPHPESGGAAHTASAAAPQTISQLLSWSSPLNHPELLSWGRRAKDRVRALSVLKRSMTELKLNDPRAVLETAAQVQELDPSLPDVYMQKSLAYAAMSKDPALVSAAGAASAEVLSRKALEEAHKAIVLWETGADKHGNLGVAYELKSSLQADLKDFAGALESAEEAVRLRPSGGAGYYYRARAREGLKGDIATILADYKRAAELEPEYKEFYAGALRRLAHPGGPGAAVGGTGGGAARSAGFPGSWLFSLGRLGSAGSGRGLALVAVLIMGTLLAIAGWKKFKS